MGHCTRALAARGAIVSALDISQAALDRVVDATERRYLAGAIHQLPADSFDLAISYLVSQHMRDAELRQQIQHVVRSLKPTGIFAMQFTYGWGQREGTVNDDLTPAKGGSVQRTLHRVAEMAHDAGAAIAWAGLNAHWIEHHASWYAVHVIPTSHLEAVYLKSGFQPA